MERININELKNWISPYLTVIGKTPAVDKNLKDIDILEYFRKLCLPNIFEKYAVILHSFWIYNLSESQISRMNLNPNEILNAEQEFPEDEYNAVKWIDFYKLKGMNFELKEAIKDSINWRFPFKQMNNEMYPGDGIIDEEILKIFGNTILKKYENEEIEIYYISLATANMEEDRMFKGKISELSELIKSEETLNTPSLIYSTEKKWAINSDYDLQFSIIGGEESLINALIQTCPDQIYSIG